MHIELVNLTQTCCVTLEILFYLILGGGWEREEKAKALHIGLNVPPIIIKGKGLACVVFSCPSALLGKTKIWLPCVYLSLFLNTKQPSNIFKNQSFYYQNLPKPLSIKTYSRTFQDLIKKSNLVLNY